MKEKITIGLIDDHNLFRKGLIELIHEYSEYKVILEASSGQELFDFLERSKSLPNVLLLDLKMKGINGLDCLKLLEKKFPGHKTIVISMFNDPPFIIEAFKNGSSGYILKNADPEELFKAIDSVHNSGTYINEKIATVLFDNLRKRQAIKRNVDPFVIQLSNLEIKILSLICDGLTNNQIAKRLHKSNRTIEGYRQRLLDKTRVNNTASLVAWAFRKGFID